jgi:hypothetical protein
MAGLTSLCVTSPTMSCLGWSLVKARQALSLFFPLPQGTEQQRGLEMVPKVTCKPGPLGGAGRWNKVVRVDGTDLCGA